MRAPSRHFQQGENAVLFVYYVLKIFFNTLASPGHEVPRPRELHPLDIVPVAESGEALLLAPGVLLHVVVQLVQLGAADLGLRYFKYYLVMLRRNDVAKIYSRSL